MIRRRKTVRRSAEGGGFWRTSYIRLIPTVALNASRTYALSWVDGNNLLRFVIHRASVRLFKWATSLCVVPLCGPRIDVSEWYNRVVFVGELDQPHGVRETPTSVLQHVQWRHTMQVRRSDAWPLWYVHWLISMLMTWDHENGASCQRPPNRSSKLYELRLECPVRWTSPAVEWCTASNDLL